MKTPKVLIVKMNESSGNVQFFVRAVRTDLTDTLDQATKGVLEYQCFQTKHMSVEECISRAVFTAGYLLRFFDLTREDLKLVRFTDEEIEYANSQRICR